jgi:hypothetical protein
MIFTMLTGTEGAAIVQQDLRAALRYKVFSVYLVAFSPLPCQS